LLRYGSVEGQYHKMQNHVHSSMHFLSRGELSRNPAAVE
jgi:hypothetical protein